VWKAEETEAREVIMTKVEERKRKEKRKIREETKKIEEKK